MKNLTWKIDFPTLEFAVLFTFSIILRAQRRRSSNKHYIDLKIGLLGLKLAKPLTVHWFPLNKALCLWHQRAKVQIEYIEKTKNGEKEARKNLGLTLLLTKLLYY